MLKRIWNEFKFHIILYHLSYVEMETIMLFFPLFVH